MPVFNGERYVEEAIRSVLNQTDEDFELIISDNASSDRTGEICSDYAARDSRIVYTENETNVGAARNYNLLFRRAQGKYFRWFNSDDLCAPEYHQRCLAVLDAHPDAVLCYGKTDIVDSEGRLLEHYEDNLDLQQEKASERYMRFHECVGLTNVIYGLMRSPAVAKTGLMGDGSYSAADVNFMAELTLYGKFIEIPETLFFRRMHSEASSWARKNERVQQEFWKGRCEAFTLSTWKKQWAYLKSIRRAPVGVQEKVRLQRYILDRMIRRRKILWKELYHVINAKVFGKGQ